jgi:hypothetical protein
MATYDSAHRSGKVTILCRDLAYVRNTMALQVDEIMWLMSAFDNGDARTPLDLQRPILCHVSQGQPTIARAFSAGSNGRTPLKSRRDGRSTSLSDVWPLER